MNVALNDQSTTDFFTFLTFNDTKGTAFSIYSTPA